MKKIITILGIIIFFASCEDVIDIELNTIDPKLVVEGTINDVDNNLTVKLTKTGDYFTPSDYLKVSGANLTITEGTKNLKSLEETEPGIYTLDIQGKENTSYTLNIESDGKDYSANVTIPQKVSIDSLSFLYSPPTPHGGEGFKVNCHFTEPQDITNYYRLKAYKIGDAAQASQTFFIFDDKFFDGNNAAMPWQYEAFQMRDTIVVELLTLDKSTYFFLKTLADIADSGGKPIGGSTPANPETNLDNGALGYFGAYTLSKDTIVIMPTH